jgi:hypothetical protein
MHKTEDILAWLEANSIWIYPRPVGQFRTETYPSIPRPYDEQKDHNGLPIFLEAYVRKHSGHPRQKFDCYLQFKFRSEGDDEWKKCQKLLREVIDNYYPDAEYTFGGSHRVSLHFSKEDSINLILQLGL